MKPYIIPSLLVFVFCLGLSQSATAQRKLLGLPEYFVKPSDFHPNADQQAKLLELTTPKSRETPWLVFSDRNNNAVYDEPGGSKITTLNLRDYFYVVEEKEGWIRIANATTKSSSLKIETLEQVVGWVPKSKMLLWPNGLVDHNTRIHKKVLLLNRLDAFSDIIKLQDQQKVEVFSGPNTSEKEKILPIFNYYFVLKREGNKILIATQAALSPYLQKHIIGWVRDSRVSIWDNRVCLEPNFEAAAFEERRANPDFQLKAFGDLTSLQKFRESGGKAKENVFWEDDPVTLPSNKLASGNTNRFKGEVVRFPMAEFGIGRSTEEAYYRSGLIGTLKANPTGKTSSFDSGVSDTRTTVMSKYIQSLKKRSEKINIFFVVEGTACTYAYQQQLTEAISAIRKEAKKGHTELRYGALLYRDLPEERVELDGKTVNRLIEHTPLTSDADRVAQFLQQAKFQNLQDQDPWTALYYGLSESLKLAGFNKNETNIIFLIGCFGDFKVNRPRREDAERTGHPALFTDASPISESLSEINAHLYAVQLRNDNTIAARVFSQIGRHLILESAKSAYNSSYGGTAQNIKALLKTLKEQYGIEAPPPQMAEPNKADLTDIPVSSSIFPGRLMRPAPGQSLDPTFFLEEALQQNVRQSISFNQDLYQLFVKMLEEGKSVKILKPVDTLDLKSDMGRLQAPSIDLIVQMLQKEGIDPNGISEFLDEQYKLFAEVYLPNYIRGASYPTVSYVLLMPELDLVDYRNTIGKCLIPGATPDKRKGLEEVYLSLLEQFSGEKIDQNNRCATREDVFRIMQGLERTGLELDVKLNVKICDITSERKVSNAEIEQLMQRFATVHEYLGSVLRLGDRYEFCYSPPGSDNRYYWIPIDKVF